MKQGELPGDLKVNAWHAWVNWGGELVTWHSLSKPFVSPLERWGCGTHEDLLRCAPGSKGGKTAAAKDAAAALQTHWKCSSELRGPDWLLPAGLLTWRVDSDFLKQCWGGGRVGGAKQETWNTEDHGLPALEMTDGKPHFTDILSSCKAQVAPILSPCLDQVWRRAAPLYGSEAPLLMPIRALCLKRATTDKKTRPPTADNTCHNPSPRPVCRQNVFSKKIINLQVIAKILSGIT